MVSFPVVVGFEVLGNRFAVVVVVCLSMVAVLVGVFFLLQVLSVAVGSVVFGVVVVVVVFVEAAVDRYCCCYFCCC